jgi:hypothetical protein
MTAVLEHPGLLLPVLSAAGDNRLPADLAILDGVDVVGMVAACKTAGLLYRVGTDDGDVLALTGSGRVLRDALRGSL